MINRLLLSLTVGVLLTLRNPAHAQNGWQAEWERTLTAAEQEGQVVYSGCGSHDYLKEFQKSFVKIKLVSVPASCSQLVSRIMAERRAGKYLETWNPSWLDMKPVQELSGQAMADAKKN